MIPSRIMLIEEKKLTWVNLGRVEKNEGSRRPRGGEGEDIFQAPRTKDWHH